ncbi:MAG TPA: DNA translocase FtsK [Candidatus Limnocylindrales bacterium]
MASGNGSAGAAVRPPDRAAPAGGVATAEGGADAEPAFALPPRTLLDDVAPRNGGAGMDHMRNADIIVSKLAGFNIPARVVRWNAGPVVTQYEVEPDPSIKVSRIEALADDLSMALAARTIRIEAPIPGKSVVGLEIPNNDFNVVALRRILDEVDFDASGSKLTFALGRDVAGHARAADLAKMPHLLIAGATGSGKSVMVNALITSLLMNATPDDVRMILMDLKRVELASYNGLPHLLVPVITEPEKAKAALKWTVNQMEHRYRQFAGAGARNIAGYNETRADPADRLPYLVVIIDELADLMMREGKNIEDPIVRLAQKARATGIHMVLATQRPSVNVVTGLIKANFPSRIAFAMASQIDSRTILDAPGAEDLIGRGDMLFQPADLPRPIRLQGVFVSDVEIGRVTEYWRSWKEHYDLAIVETDEEGTGSAEALDDDDADRLLPDAVEVIREYDRASASLLQRRLKIGYARAARIIDQLEARGYIGAFDGSNARQVLRREEPAAGSGSEGFDDDEG